MRLHISFYYDFTEDTCNYDISLEQLIQIAVLEFCSYAKLLVPILLCQIIL